MSQAEEDADMEVEALADITSRCRGDLRTECPLCRAEPGKPCAEECPKEETISE